MNNFQATVCLTVCCIVHQLLINRSKSDCNNIALCIFIAIVVKCKRHYSISCRTIFVHSMNDLLHTIKAALVHVWCVVTTAG